MAKKIAGRKDEGRKDEGRRYADGWINFLVGLGLKGMDKTEYTGYQLTQLLDDGTLTDIYAGDGLGARIVNLPAEDMIRRWFTVEGDPEKKILKELERLKAQSHIADAVRWARLYGGSILLMGVRDGRQLEETVRVHRSRCLLFHGVTVPREAQSKLSLDLQYWGLSVLQSMWSRLANFSAMEKGIANIMMEFIIGVFKLSNLKEMLAEGQEQDLHTRMSVIQLSKSVLRAVLLGEDEEFDRNVASVAGVADVMDRFMMLISGISGIPVTRLFGRSPAGLNATGESDMRIYYDMVASQQSSWLKPAIQPLIDHVATYTRIKDPSIQFTTLYESTEKELVETRKAQAETDVAYINTGVVDPEEVRQMRFTGGYSLEMAVEEEDRPDGAE